MKKSEMKIAFTGMVIGVVNGLLGSGGGMVAVPLLEKLGLPKKEAHTNAVAVILPLSILSAILYLMKEYVTVAKALPYIPTGVLGAFLGTCLLKKISPIMLKKVFGVFMIYAGIRLLVR